jgi:hypothetical protein
LTEDQKKAKVVRLGVIGERLKTIGAEIAESKAIKILTGLGFS